MKKNFIISAALVLTAAFIMAGSTTAFGQYPTKSIRFIVPFPPGGPTDVLGRVIGKKLSEQIGQSVLVDNRPGAGGILGYEVTAESPADGYTIVMGANMLAFAPHLFANKNPIQHLAPISRTASMPNILIVNPSFPAKTLKELVQLARANPGKYNFGSGGVGTSNHLGSALLISTEKLNMVHVPFKGASRAMVALMGGGQIDMVVIGVPTAIPQIKAGKVRALAILSDEREPAIPDVPTAAEAGFPYLKVYTWFGILTRAGTPKNIVDRLSAEIAKVLADPAVKKRLIGIGFKPMSTTPEQFSDFIKAESERWGKVIREAGIKRK